MADFFNKFLNYIGIEESEEEEYSFQEQDYEAPAEQNDNVVSFGTREKRRSASNVVSMAAASQMKMILYHPINYQDAQSIIDNFRSRKPVIVNMEDLEVEVAQRILDFISGAAYALDGDIFKISKGIFVIAPVNYDVIGNGDSELGDDGLI
ncbi:cell division protein SepF [Eubacteriales bacterium OttesenSCG-928-K08]|nr:cell division protein SepF [Eubacteriales bacterium OttesenSCG-928-K08]